MVPSRGVLGQRTLETPAIFMTNRHSLPEAEDFTSGFRAQRGPLHDFDNVTHNVPQSSCA